MRNHDRTVTPTMKRAFAFAEAMGWEMNDQEARVCFFVPEADRHIADAVGELIPNWDIEHLDDGEGAIVWTFWLGNGDPV
jgi:hypothetical protein